MLRSALLFLVGCLTLVGSASAYAPTTGNVCTFAWTGGGTSGPAVSEAAAEAEVISRKSAWMTDAGWTLQIGCSGTCSDYTGSVCDDTTAQAPSKTKYWKYFYNGTITQPGTGWAVQATRTGAQDTCPNGGTLSGGQCVCPSGYSDTGSACVQDTCPAAGTNVGVVNITAGYALSPVPDADDMVVDYGAEVYSPGHCRLTSQGWCPVNIVPSRAAAEVQVWRGQVPTDQGLYRVSVDAPAESAGGAACTPSASDHANPSSAAPTCPTGNVGTVNGKAVCLGTMVAQGVNFGAKEGSGNPRAGTAGTDSNAAREPDAGNGGGPDARGGPGVTTGRNGSVGTGGDGTAGAGSIGSSPSVEVNLDLPTDYQRDATGQATNAKLQEIITDGLKINETGTPNGSDAGTYFDGWKSAAQAYQDGIPGAISSDGKSTGWSWSLQLPTSCSPLSVDMRYGGFGEVIVLDVCEYQPVFHDLMSLAWAAGTLFFVTGMFARTLREA